jgi:hypothetical protein
LNNTLGGSERALADLDTAIRLGSLRETYTLHAAKADILFSDGRFNEALSEYQAALANLPNISAEIAAKVGVQLLTSGLLNPMTIDKVDKEIDNAKRRKKFKNVNESYCKEQIQLCEAVVRRASSNGPLSEIVKGMSKLSVLQSVLINDRIVVRTMTAVTVISSGYDRSLPQPECIVTVTKTGLFDDKTIRVLIFSDKNELKAEKYVPLKEVSTLPEVLRTLSPQKTMTQTFQVQIFRLHDRLIYEDDKFIVSFGEVLFGEGKRIRITFFKDGKALFSAPSLRPLW